MSKMSELHAEITELWHEGWSAPQIAAHTGLSVAMVEDAVDPFEFCLNVPVNLEDNAPDYTFG